MFRNNIKIGLAILIFTLSQACAGTKVYEVADTPELKAYALYRQYVDYLHTAEAIMVSKSVPDDVKRVVQIGVNLVAPAADILQDAALRYARIEQEVRAKEQPVEILVDALQELADAIALAEPKIRDFISSIEKVSK